MDADDPAPAPPAALRALLARLAPLLPPSSPEPSALDTALAGLHDWLDKLAALDALPPAKDSPLLALFREKLLAYAAPREVATEGGARERAGTVLEVVGRLMAWVLERALEVQGGKKEDVQGWGGLLVAVLLGVEGHLGDNDYDDGRSDREIQDYRKPFAEYLFAPLVRVVFPTPDSLPAASGQVIDDGRRTAIPNEAKYAALAILATAMSRHKENKRALRELLPADHLGAIFQGGADAHLSQLALEVAFRIAPPAPKRKSQSSTAAAPPASEREKWIKALFSRQRFGTGAEEWRRLFDALDATRWEEETRALLVKLAAGHIKRSQHFDVLALEYNGHALLERPTESQQFSSTIPPKPTLAQVASGFYESTSVWFCRHILALSVREPPEMLEQRKSERRKLGLKSQVVEDEDDDAEVEKDRAVVHLAGVQKVHVEDLGAEHDLLRVTLLLSPSSPLTLSSRAHPSLPAHIGTALKPATESQLGARVGRTHRLVMVLSARGNTLAVLRKVLEERRTEEEEQIYPRLGDELYRFPLRAPGSASTTAAHKAVAFAPTPDAIVDKRSSGAGAGARKPSAVARAPRKSSETGPVVSEEPPAAASGSALAPAQGVDERESSQDASLRRRQEVAALAELDAAARASTSGSGSAGSGGGGGSSPAKGKSRAQVGADEGEGDFFAGHEFGGGFDEEEEGEGLVPPAKIGATASSSKGDGKAGVAAAVAPQRQDGAASAQQAKPKPAVCAPVPLQRTSSDLTDPLTEEEDDDDEIEILPAPAPAPAKKVVKKPKPAAVKAPRRSPRLSDGSSESPAPPSKAKAKKAAAPAAPAKDLPAAAKKVVAPTPRERETGEKENDKPTSASTAGGGDGGSATRPRRQAASKAAAMLQGAKKRVRTESDAEEGGEGAGATSEQDSKSRAYAPGGKKVVQPAAAAPAKRRKTTPAPSEEPEPDTDYDEDEAPSTLDRTRRSDSPAKRYGRERKVPAANGGRRKAAKPAKKEKGGRSPAKTRKGKEREVEGSEREEQEEQEDRPTRSRAPGKKVVKKVEEEGSREVSVLENESPPPAKKHDKRVADDIPPPRDLTAGALERVKELEAPSKPRSREGKAKPIGSFSQLVRAPSDEVAVAEKQLATAEDEDEADIAVKENDFFDHGFNPDDLAHIPAIDAAASGPSYLRDVVAQRGSPSPFLDPAKDETFVDRAVPEAAASPVIAQVAPAAKSAVAKPLATPAVKPVHQAAPAAKPSIQSQAQAPAPMQVDSPAAPHGADDSGVHFGLPLGSEGDELGGKTGAVQAGVSTSVAAMRSAAPLSAPAGTTGLARFGAAPAFDRPQLAPKPVSHDAAHATGAGFSFAGAVAGPSGASTGKSARPAAGTPALAYANKAVQVGASLGAVRPPPPPHERRDEPRDERAREGETSRPPPQMFRPGFVPPRLPAATAAKPPAAQKSSGNGNGHGKPTSGGNGKGKGKALPSRFPAQRSSGPSTSTPHHRAGGRPSTSPPQMAPLPEEGDEEFDAGPWEDEDEELFAFAESFGRALVEKQRARRRAREALYAQGIVRFNEMLGRYLASAHQETAEIAHRVTARAEQLATPQDGDGLGQGALAEAWRACGRMWEDAEGALAELRA
ncbi:hypothetical protein JCM10450v2_007059 [Rhodotorula kratochvilovae]